MSIGVAVVVLTVIGLLGAIILVLATKFLYVPEDERVGKITACMPGANCGACGYAGCADYAKAIVAGAPVNRCIPGGEKAAQDAAEIMGVQADAVEVQKAFVVCQGSLTHTQNQYDYEGIKSCAACAALYAGHGSCSYGCLGFGDCEKVCEFGAITVENGLAKIDQEKCTGCGACEKACPKNIIWMRPQTEKPVVACANKERGAVTRKACSTGCIACMKCEKTCPHDAIHVKDNVARVDYEKCTGCGKCEEVCPVHVIIIPRIASQKAQQ